MLSKTHVQLVQTTFEQVKPIAAQASQLFYGRLFEIAPQTRALFTKTDMSTQGNKLMQTIALAVSHLENLEAIIPTVKDLGARHVRYGVSDDLYQPVGEALLWTLEQGLGAAFTPDVKEAWTQVYTLLAQTAIAGAQEAAINPIA